MEITRLKTAFAAIAVILVTLWLLSLSPGAFTSGFWITRTTLVYCAGICAIGFMSCAVILAARPVFFEDALGGLDKYYRLHKWLGIAAALSAVVHWLLRITPPWMAKQGWLTLPPRPLAHAQASTGFSLLHDLREVASGVGEWSLYLLLRRCTVDRPDINELIGINMGPTIAFADYSIKNNYSLEDFHDKLELIYQTIYFS